MFLVSLHVFVFAINHDGFLYGDIIEVMIVFQ